MEDNKLAKVLVVDDEPNIVELLTVSLKFQNFEVYSANSGNEALRIARNRYQNGYASYLDELDAQRTLFTTQLNLVTVKNNLLLAQIDLYRALGGGWTPASTQ